MLGAPSACCSVKLRVWWWTDPPTRINALHVQDRCLTALKEALIAHGIDLPFPTTQVLLHDQTEEGDGDRRRQREGWPAGRGDVPAPRPLTSAPRHGAPPVTRGAAGDTAPRVTTPSAAP
jgi:small conductance mechanosensitive channel